MLNSPRLMIWLLLWLFTHNAVSSEIRYRMYNDEGESIGTIVTEKSDEYGRVVVKTRFNMQGEKLFMTFSMQGKDTVVLGEGGLHEFVLDDQFESTLFSSKKRTQGNIVDDKLVLLIEEKDKTPSEKIYSLSEFDTIARLNTRDAEAYAQLLRSAPISLRSLNLMMGEIEEINIEVQGKEKITFNGGEVEVEKYRITQSQGETDIWLLEDGRVYRQGGMFGYMILETESEPELGW